MVDDSPIWIDSIFLRRPYGAQKMDENRIAVARKILEGMRELPLILCIGKNVLNYTTRISDRNPIPQLLTGVFGFREAGNRTKY